MTFLRTGVFATALLAATSMAEPATTHAEFESKNEFKCNAPLEVLAQAEVREHAGFRYELRGSTVALRRASPAKGPARIGVLSAIKDAEPQTLALLTNFVETFEKRDVALIVVGGDTADDPAVLERVYAHLTQKTSRPILTVAGNTERSGAHNHAVAKTRKAGAQHLLNGGLVRRLDAEGFDVVTLSGYYDPRYAHGRGVCIYKKEDVQAVIAAAKSSDDPVILLSHGPPRQEGKSAVDFVPGAGNVGDQEITRALTEGNIPFGIHGHILEAGGIATDLRGKPLREKKTHASLYLNPGSANPLPWKMNTGKTAYGLAAVLTVDGKRASYEILRAPKPKD